MIHHSECDELRLLRYYVVLIPPIFTKIIYEISIIANCDSETSHGHNYLRQQSWMRLCFFGSVCVCVQDYCKSNQAFSLKVDVIIRPGILGRIDKLSVVFSPGYGFRMTVPLPSALQNRTSREIY